MIDVLPAETQALLEDIHGPDWRLMTVDDVVADLSPSEPRPHGISACIRVEMEVRARAATRTRETAASELGNVTRAGGC